MIDRCQDVLCKLVTLVAGLHDRFGSIGKWDGRNRALVRIMTSGTSAVLRGVGYVLAELAGIGSRDGDGEIRGVLRILNQIPSKARVRTVEE